MLNAGLSKVIEATTLQTVSKQMPSCMKRYVSRFLMDPSRPPFLWQIALKALQS